MGIGFDRTKIIKKYNFVPDAETNLRIIKVDGSLERYTVFYGRISEEKVICVLTKIWEQLPDISLVVMSGVPLEENFKTWAGGKDNVYFWVIHSMTIVKGSEFVVFPSGMRIAQWLKLRRRALAELL